MAIRARGHALRPAGATIAQAWPPSPSLRNDDGALTLAEPASDQAAHATQQGSLLILRRSAWVSAARSARRRPPDRAISWPQRNAMSFMQPRTLQPTGPAREFAADQAGHGAARVAEVRHAHAGSGAGGQRAGAGQQHTLAAIEPQQAGVSAFRVRRGNRRLARMKG